MLPPRIRHVLSPGQIVTANRSPKLAPKAALHMVGHPIPLGSILGIINVLKQERNHRPIRPVLKRVPVNFKCPKPVVAPSRARGVDFILSGDIVRSLIGNLVAGGSRVAAHPSDPGRKFRVHFRAQMLGQRLDHFLQIRLEIIRIQIIAIPISAVRVTRQGAGAVGQPTRHAAAARPAGRFNLNRKHLVIGIGKPQLGVQRRPTEVGPGRLNNVPAIHVALAQGVGVSRDRMVTSPIPNAIRLAGQPQRGIGLRGYPRKQDPKHDHFQTNLHFAYLIRKLRLIDTSIASRKPPPKNLLPNNQQQL